MVNTSKLFCLSLVVGFGASIAMLPHYSDSFSDPVDVPPGNNTEAPIHEGPVVQEKQGALAVDGFISDTNFQLNSYLDLLEIAEPSQKAGWGRVFIDTSGILRVKNPDGSLEVFGDLPLYLFQSSSGIYYKPPGTELY